MTLRIVPEAIPHYTMSCLTWSVQMTYKGDCACRRDKTSERKLRKH